MPYVVSNIVAVLLLLATWRKPRIARVLFFLIFGWASWVNKSAVLDNPSQYLDYAQYTFLFFYKSFILGFFGDHIQEIVLVIAFCQLCIAVSMLLKGLLFKIGGIGAILFFLAIAPLGVGAAFPSTIIGSLAMLLLLIKSGRDYLWKPD